MKILTLIIGIGMLGAALYLSRDTQSFVATAARAEGTVVGYTNDLIRSNGRCSDSGRNSGGRCPVVHFVTQSGQSIEFTGNLRSSFHWYSKGQKLEVLYRPSEPQNARINDFLSLWFGPLIVGGMGGFFLFLGFVPILLGSLAKRVTRQPQKSNI